MAAAVVAATEAKVDVAEAAGSALVEGVEAKQAEEAEAGAAAALEEAHASA